MVSDERTMQVLLSVLYVVSGVLIATAAVLMGWLPGARARARYHPAARTITRLGWCSLVCWPLWPVAMIWASRSRRSRPRPKVHIRVSPPRLTAAADPIEPVERVSKLAIEQPVMHASSAAST
jgi:hypothetical protein